MPGQNQHDEKDQERNQNDAVPQRAIVIGASAGGLEAFKKIVTGLPADFAPPVFIVWHMSPDVRGILPQVLNKVNTIYAAHAYDKEEIKNNRIYVAPPDHHLLIEDGRVRVTHGPKENRFRPAVDPLFRSAAYAYGNRVIGIVLSGALDDGTAGLWMVKHHGGIAIVQDPADAEVPSMPKSAIREVEVDHCTASHDMAALLVRLSNESIVESGEVVKDPQTKKEIEIAAEESPLEKGILQFGALSPFTCPECHGVLLALRNDNLIRYRCHTGHAYSLDTLMAAVLEKIEDSLYGAIRGMDESIMLLNHLGDHYAEANQPRLAALYFKKAKEVEERSQHVRKAVLTHEQFNNDTLRQEAEQESKV